MKLNRQQRINAAANSIVTAFGNIAEEARGYLSKGIDVEGKNGYPALKATGDEVKEALGDNLKNIETLCEFIIDGKSNKMPTATAKAKPKK